MARKRLRAAHLMYWPVLIASACTLFAAAWIVIPAPNRYVLVFGVGSPELSPVLLAVSAVLCAIAALYARRLHIARLSFVFSLISAALSCWPIAQVPSTLTRFHDTLQQRLGLDVQGAPVSVRDLFRPPVALPSHLLSRVKFSPEPNSRLALQIYEPGKGDGPYPILFQVYGGAWRGGEPSDNEWFARYFASRGYVVVAADYRHAPEFTWPVQLEDVETALQWTRSHAKDFNGDPHRIIALGRSSGAHLAMMAAYNSAPGSIKGVISLYGPVDLAEGWRHPPRPDPLDARGILDAFLGGTPAEMPERYREASPVTLASRPQPPTLLIYGRRDHIVEARFGAQLDEALRRAGNRSALLEIPWSEHAFDVIPNGLGGQLSRFYTEAFMEWAIKR